MNISIYQVNGEVCEGQESCAGRPAAASGEAVAGMVQ